MAVQVWRDWLLDVGARRAWNKQKADCEVLKLKKNKSENEVPEAAEAP